MRIYLASSWRNTRQPEVLKALRDAGHEVYDFRNPEPGYEGFRWSEIDPHWEYWNIKQQINAYENPISQKALDRDFKAMYRCDALIMLQPCGRSAALELGWAIGAKKRTMVIMAEGQEPELMIRLANNLVTSVREALEVLEQWS